MKKRRKKKQSIIKIWFFTIIIMYFTYKVIVGLVFDVPTFEVVRYGEIVKGGKYDCLIVRNEKVIKSPSEGEIKYFVEEGEKVEKYFKVAEIYSNLINEKEKAKLIDLNKRIKQIQTNKSNLFDMDTDKLDSEINNIIQEIKKNSVDNNFYKVTLLKEEFKNKIEKKRRISGDKSFSGLTLEHLKTEKERLENKFRNSLLEIKSNESGVISYNIDGFEEILTPQNIANIKYDFFESMEIKLNSFKLSRVIYDQPIFKIVDNTSWYIIAFTNLKDSKTFRIGQSVTIDFYDDKINGLVENIYSDNNKGIIVIKTSQYAKNFTKERKIKLNIIKEHYSGLKIHKDSIVEKNGQFGVFILDINKKAKFTPIKIKGYDENFAIVYNTVYFEKDDNDVYKRVKTIDLYDEVLRNGAKYKENEVIY